jgi:hypothetical protein
MHLTNRIAKGKAMLASSANVGDAGAPNDEIIVTPAMIAAGRRELFHYCYKFGNEDEVVENIFREMIKELRLVGATIEEHHCNNI